MLPGMSQCLPTAACTSSGSAALEDGQAEQIAAVFKALSDPVRVKLLRHISANCCSSVCACHMPESLGISQPTLSYHLGRLVKAGLISREMRHKWAHYRATPQGLAVVRQFLADLRDTDCCDPVGELDEVCGD